jgi:ligand-binding sensor domain-containing protein
LHTEGNENIWIGTYLDGMYKYNHKNKSLNHYVNSIKGTKTLPGNNVWSIIDNDENTLWIGTMGEGLGLFHKNGRLISHFVPIENDPNSISNIDVFIALKDKNSNFWFGTRNGLNRYVESTNNFKQYLSNPNDSSSLYGAWVYEIFQDSEGALWIGT